jgi:ketopantoate reductase
MQVVVYGAGSVGSVLGGMLAINHHVTPTMRRRQYDFTTWA